MSGLGATLSGGAFMRPPSTTDVILKFKQTINSRHADAVCSMMTEDAVFIDSLGNRVEGLALLRSAWEHYFKIVPDYSIQHTEIFVNENRAAMIGSAGGTFSKNGVLMKINQWRVPAAWRVVVKGGKIALWQVFADNEPLREIMRA